jgi:hypothetical protein
MIPHHKYMKHKQYIAAIWIIIRALRLMMSLSSVLFLGSLSTAAQSAPSVDISPLVTGQNFTIAVTASPDVTEASATFSFRPGQPRAIEIPLKQQGQIWTGAGLVPSDLALQLPGNAGAMAKVVLLDAAGKPEERVIQLAVKIESITAVFDGGVLTVAGDD